MTQKVHKECSESNLFLFVALFCIIQFVEPAFLYEKNGALRKFGIGRRKKTVIPIWFLTLILAIFCYLFVLYYLAIPKFRY